MEDLDGNETTLIPSPYKKGDFIKYGGQLHQILHFVCTTMDGLMYMTRDTRTNKVFHVPLPVVPRNDKGGEEDYFQITGLNKDNEATLRPWSGGGTERRMKVRWDEDVELIKDGLKMEDKEVFCTVGVLMGKEALGDIKYMDKDPPILKMPDLVMDTIFCLTSRLVLRRWGFDLLPIKNFVTCTTLHLYHDTVDPSPSTIDAYFYPHPALTEELSFRGAKQLIQGVQPLLDASVLEDANVLSIDAGSGRPEDQFQTILEQCGRIENFSFSDEGAPIMDPDNNQNKDWVRAKKFISANINNLKDIRMTASLKELDFQGNPPIRSSTSLQVLEIILSREVHSSIRDLQCLPKSLLELFVLNLTLPLTKSQLLWIATNLTNLTHLSFNVYHQHCQEEGAEVDEDEIDVDMILNLTSSIPSLKHADLFIGHFISGRADDGGPCQKARELYYQMLEEYLGGWETVICYDLELEGQEAFTFRKYEAEY